MSKTMKVAGMTVVVTKSVRARDAYGRSLRAVYLTLPNVAPPGVAWDAAHEGRKFELVSFNGGAVEVYVVDPSTGIPMYQGTVRDYFPAAGESHTWFRAAWSAEQPSKAAAEAFEASCCAA